ncbi:uncharacterized protein LOC129948388 isoform X3 [Eupeodes corollae]|uniref:uncharacterized protein LOC129948388 isoform X3 n=1 Tax=Eupeodes corollae TaxID=290404 RepID=UPI00249270E1|nr:uncharacterized protein LOC129948388 isoform X3 [Eupeodes corollae]
MEKPIHPSAVGPKVSQIANLFQRKQPIEIANPVEVTTIAPPTKEPQMPQAPTVTVVRTESHSTRFNHARSLFEKLSVENNSNNPAALSVKMSRSGSREDNLCSDINYIDRRSPSPAKHRNSSPFPPGQQASLMNNNCPSAASGQINGTKFIEQQSKLHHNISRIKSEETSSGGEKPEKPERKFNSRELIEKQKKWTSHFTKTKTNRSHSDPNRCDIIRTGPGTALIPGSIIQMKDPVLLNNKNANANSNSNSNANVNSNNLSNNSVSSNNIFTGVSKSLDMSLDEDMPPSPPVRHSVHPPEIKPRSTVKIGSPVKSPPLPPIPSSKPKIISPVKFHPERIRSPTKVSEPPPPPPTLPTSPPPPPAKLVSKSSIEDIPPELPRKRSMDILEDQLQMIGSGLERKRSSVDKDSGMFSPAHAVSSSPSPAPSASSGPSSPVHTEDEKQENESTEKSEYFSMPSENEGRAQKSSERSENDPSIQSVQQEVVVPRIKKVSSICLNLPAAGLGSRPASIISSVSTDEGGFNEPSPEIKAKLKPAYDFEPQNFVGLGGGGAPDQQQHHNPLLEDEIDKSMVSPIVDNNPLHQYNNEDEEKPSLNYVDVGYRLNPDGSESREVFGESELYETAKIDLHKSFHANGFAQETTTVYAVIKPDVPPPAELFYHGEPVVHQEITSSPAHSPPKIPPSPLRRRSSDISGSVGSSSKSPPPPPPLIPSVTTSPIKKPPCAAPLETQDEFESPELPALPQRPPPLPEGPPLDMQDIEYADMSGGEDNDILEDDQEDEEIEEEEEVLNRNKRTNESLEMGREDSLPDDMTADEAERLLSSRQQPLLSDEQAKEVEQILSAPAAASTATPATPVTEVTQIVATKIVVSSHHHHHHHHQLVEEERRVVEDDPEEEGEEELEPEPEPQPKCNNYERVDDEDEPEWLRDVLEAPNRSLENSIHSESASFLDVDNEPHQVDLGVTVTANKVETTYDEEINCNTTFDVGSEYNKHDIFNQTYVQESLHDSIVSAESADSTTHNSLQTTTIDDSIISSKHNSNYSLADHETTATTTTTQLDENQFYIPEYPPVRSKEVYVEGGVHYFEDGNFWMEVPGLLESDDDDITYPPIAVKKNNKIRFSSGAIQVFSTFSVTDYDRRNEDVDPVAASAEYELEKRVEKMHVFPVELMKGPEGLGLSIIGMGVGADAGLEKLGIFVKTITDNGAAARDGRIQVNDQIIEVDGKSLVGVTQAYAASVLRNTSGLVKFQIGRERDPENSEVAQLIRLSLQADKEKEERLKRQQEEYLRRTLDYSEDSTQPASANSSVSEGPTSPVQVEHPMEVEATHSQEVESLKRLLQESEMSCLLKEDIITNLRRKLVKLETTGNEDELLNERLRQTERELTNIKKEASNLQNMLQQSQSQYMALDKKYNKAKRLVREFQQREVDMVHREEFYQQLLQEKDTEYNALVKKLKDRVINLEHELQETQRKAGFPVVLPYDSTTLKLTPQMVRKAPPKPLFHKLETELSDTEISDLSPDGEGVKTATVERKVPIKDELDAAVPQHELLDNSATKTKIDLGRASRGGLANRQLPTGKKSLSNSSSDCGLDSEDDMGTNDTSSTGTTMVSNGNHQNGHHNLHNSDKYVREQQINQLYAQVHKDHKTHSTIPNIFKTTSSDSSFGVSKDLNSSYDSILGSNDKLSENDQTENWMYPSRRRGNKAPPASFTDQLNQVLSDRERRLGDGSSRHSSDDYTEINKSQSSAAISAKTLINEIRQAVNEAQPKVKNVVPQSLSPPGTVPWQQQSQLSSSHQQGPPSPTSMSSGSTSPGYSPSRCMDLSGSSSSFSERKSTHNYKGGPVHEWTKEQVGHWLMGIDLDRYIPVFKEHNVEGGALLTLDSKDFKTLGVSGDDKQRLKRRLKDLKASIEKERKDQERERREREKAIRKAEKKAAKKK